MSINNKYAEHRNHIRKLKDKGRTWEEIRNLSFVGANLNEALEKLASFGFLDYVSPEIWLTLVNDVEEKDKNQVVYKLGRAILNDAKIPEDDLSSWQLYKQKLRDNNFSEDSILNIEKSSYEILRGLTMDQSKTGPVKGLVMGNVQSGKTANMAGLMAMAADNGFNYFIILSGVIENLRKQTEKRLHDDMKGTDKNRRSGYLNWTPVENPSLRDNTSKHNLSNFNLSPNSRDRYFTVCLKNKSRLRDLKNWLLDDKNQAKNLKILIIDDEADQASINTKNMNNIEDANDEEQYTAINKLIRNLVNEPSFGGMNYISYTATPYANVLNETSRDSLYPRNFITLLEPSEDYIGPKQIFGTEEPEKSPKVDIVLEIPDKDAEIVKEIQKGHGDDPLPNSFKKSINWFLLSVAAIRSTGYKKPLSMLVHTSFKIDHHEIIAEKIQNYLEHIKDNFDSFITNFEELYKSESANLTKQTFINNMSNYSTPDTVPELPEWTSVLKELEYIFELKNNDFVSHIQIGDEGQLKYHTGIHLAIDNSRTKASNQHVRLVYPSKNNLPEKAPAFIVVGGNTLSRGLTLEGLTTTYFLRTTNQADTLMQMGRWFGYRKGYELFPRVWLDRKAFERFTFLSQMNEELRDEIRNYSSEEGHGQTPTDIAPKIKNSPNRALIRITANNKSQASKPVEFDFRGFNSQTIYFEKDEEQLTENLNTTEEFLNQLDTPEIDRNLMIWRNVDNLTVKDFLEKYNVCSSDIKMSTIPALINWLKENDAELNNWSVVLSSIGDINETASEKNGWTIHGYSPKSVIRTRRKKNSNEQITSIGSLRNPSDLLAEFKKQLPKEEKSSAQTEKVQELRREYGYGDTPQLLIYRISKGDKENLIKKNKNGQSDREPLDFPEDLIGINIMIPGFTKNKNLATYIQAIDVPRDDNIDEDEYGEEGE